MFLCISLKTILHFPKPALFYILNHVPLIAIPFYYRPSLFTQITKFVLYASTIKVIRKVFGRATMDHKNAAHVPLP